MASFWLTLFILIERRRPLHSRFIYATGMALIFFFPSSFRQNVSHLAHFFGFVFGIPGALIYFLLFYKKIRSEEVWIDTTPPPVEELEEDQFSSETPC